MSALWMGVVVHLWQTTLVLGLIALLALPLRRAPARYQEGLWTAGLLKLLVPLPLLAGLWPALRRLGAAAEQQQTFGPAVKTLSQLAYPEMLWVSPMEAGGGSPTSTLVVAATVLWGVGVAAIVGLWWRRGRVPVPAGDGPWHASAEILDRVSRAARAANLPLSRIRITDLPVMPCIRNLRRPLVMVSTVVVEHLRVDELQAVLTHENAHRRRGDLWRRAAQGVATSVYFFYPPAWWLERHLRESAEMACDEAVLAAGIEPRTYVRALARTVDLELASTPAPALSSGARLRARLERIQNAERYTTMNRHRFAVGAAFIAAVALSFVPVADGTGLVSAVGELQVAGESPAGEWVTAAQLSGLNGLEIPVDLTYPYAPLAQVLEDLGVRAGFEVYFMSQAALDLQVQVAVRGTPVREVLGLLADPRGIEYRVVDPETLIVRVRRGFSPTPFDWSFLLGDKVPGDVFTISPDEIDIALAKMRQENGLVDDEQWLETLRQNGMTEAQVREQMRAWILEQRDLARAEQRDDVQEMVTVTAPAGEPAPVATPVDAPMRVGGEIREPERIRYVAPEYPQEARRARMEGFVILQAVIDKDGNVSDVEVLRGLGLGLDVAAANAVKQWKYTPTYYDGERVAVILTVNVVFQLIQ